MSEMIKLKSRDGREFQAALALPPGDKKAGTVILLQEWWGLNAHIQDLTDRMAVAGFVTLAPDLYKGQVATDSDSASKLMQALSWAEAAQTIGGAFDFLKGHARGNGKVGITGFCMGGAGTLYCAANLPGLAAAVAFYGLPPAPSVDWTKAETPPIQAHFSKTDPWAKPDLAAGIRDTLVARGRTMELHVYDAEHAFMNNTRPDVYSPENATLAWGRTVAFFQRYLAS
ncbi:MAG TPA: dienelactone hydrolase family protein [Myxococcota bacterium]|nr:dienelactone hydrolase family protein [Myxococcota bacterium]